MEVKYIVDKCWCGETKTEKFFDGDWYVNNNKISAKLGKCIKCGTVRTLLVNNNTKIDYNETNIYSTLSKRHLNSIKTIRSNIKDGNLLEIGCSTGLILKEIRKFRNNSELLGVDLNKNAIENSVDKNLNLIYSDIENISSKFNNIIALHVIEHIPQLELFFSQLSKLLKNNSIIYFSTPNIESYNFVKDGSHWGALNPLQHTWHFSKKTIVKMVKKFLPNAKIKILKSSWVWEPKYIGFLNNYLIEADQIEIVIEQ